MSKNFFQGSSLRYIILESYKLYARNMFWRTKGPKIFVNSIPKAGTHLLTSILDEIPTIMLSRTHIDPWDIHQGEGNHLPLADFKPDIEKFESILEKIKARQVVTGHLPWKPEIIKVLVNHNFKIIFVTRNPEDILVSRLHYIKGLKRHHLHDRLINNYHTDEERLNALLAGFPVDNQGRPGTDSYNDYLSKFDGWKKCKIDNNFAIIKFEEIIGEKGGGSFQKRRDIIKLIVNMLGFEQVDKIVQEVDISTSRKKSVTFRKGVIGEGKNLGIIKDKQN